MERGGIKPPRLRWAPGIRRRCRGGTL